MLWKWGKFRAEQFSGKCFFVGISEVDIKDDDTVECHHVGIPHEPLEFLEKAVASRASERFGEAHQSHAARCYHQKLSWPTPQVGPGRGWNSSRNSRPMAAATKAEELKLRLRMPEHVRKLMSGKRVLFCWDRCWHNLTSRTRPS